MSRLEQARAEIARRRSLAESATPGPWHDCFSVHGDPTVVTDPDRAAFTVVADISTRPADYGRANTWHIAAAADPVHVLAVLAAADATLDRHARTHTCQARWLDDDQAAENAAPTTGQYVWPVLHCADAAAVLDLYAPEPSCSTCGQPMSTPPCTRSPGGAGGHTVAGGVANSPGYVRESRPCTDCAAGSPP